MSSGSRLPEPNSSGGASLIQNWVSFIGAALALVSLVNILFLVLLNYFRPSPYLGIFAYMVLPAILIGGLILIALGVVLERNHRRTLAPDEIPRLPIINLNSPKQQQTLAVILAEATLFIGMSAAGSYRAYEFTDSVTFCGQVCHTVMKPEYTTYLQSPHARVACVECHVGSGAGWYVRSKLSGSYQVYAAAFHRYPRLIPTPVANLRPAQQTCEQCHWPSRFYGAQLKVFTHFSYDEENTPREVRMLINIGGAEPRGGRPSGIHWHMNIANRITFIAADPQRQVIPWVQAEDRQGHITTYVAKDSKLTPEQISYGSRHLMDCIDCHDRPSHIFTPPDQAVDNALLAGRLTPQMPFIKQQAVTALTATYADENTAMGGISKSLTDFYSSKYPQQYGGASEALRNTVTEVQHLYVMTIFPYMKVDWRTHPNNVGHYYVPGCFRCHDGQHVSGDGKVIPKDCDSCHSVIAEVATAKPTTATMPKTQFVHPVDIGDLKAATCSDCHTGASM